MANWISSKLKVAETFLQQIDQQAAESLGKNERPRSDDLKFDTPTKTGGTVSLKDQLKKKTQDDTNEYDGKLKSDPNNINLLNNNNNNNNNNNQVNDHRDPKPKSSNTTTTTATLTDSDWTELLSSSPNQPTTSGNRSSSNAVRGLRQGNLEGKRVRKSNVNNLIKSARRSDVAPGNSKLNGKPSDGEESSSSGRSSSVGSQIDGKILEVVGRELDPVVMGKDNPKDEGNGGRFDSKKLSSDDFSRLVNKNRSSEMVLVSEKKVDKVGVNDVRDRLRDTGRGKRGSNVGSGSSVSDDLKRGSSSTSDGGGSVSDTESGSSSDSESEREREERRKRREKILAEKAAAKAIEAIKERENMVARLEGEKQSLEKILEERAKQHAQEASQLQTTMMQTMEAAELEKQKHNNTRMEVLARLAKLETSNADLARSFASKQKNLEVEIDRVAELREQIELKEVAHGELRRRISNTHQTGKHLNQLAAAKGVEFEREILEAEYSFITDKIERLQDKAKKLEANIAMTRKEIEDSTEVEIELKRRLGQLTDHLIQKQAQVEALSSEKATLLFRIEAVSRLLDENESTMNDFSSTSSRDMESGMLELTDSKLRPLIEDRFRSGRKHLGSLVQQLDAIFLAGAVFLRRNSTAKLWSLVYLVCLHFWVIYILMSHWQPSNEVGSGAVFSLENINNTAGV